MAMLATTERMSESSRAPREIEVPASTAWPFVLAFGFVLLFAGLADEHVRQRPWRRAHSGWLCRLVPRSLPLRARRGCAGGCRGYSHHYRSSGSRVASRSGQIMRAWLPVKTYPVSAGVKGGLGGRRSDGRAGLYLRPDEDRKHLVPDQSSGRDGVCRIDQARTRTAEFIPCWTASRLLWYLHIIVSALVGLLYGAMLPMFAHRPILLGGLLGPVLWSGLLYSIMGLVNPLLASRIDWSGSLLRRWPLESWRAWSSCAQPQIPTFENRSFAIRAGIEAPGTMPPREGGEDERP